MPTRTVMLEQMLSAEQAFIVTNYDRQQDTTWLLAQSDTGTQYEVMTTRYLPQEGAMVVAVLKPLRVCTVMSLTGALHWTYVAEKFFRSTPTNGGDLWSVTRAIARALDREPIGL